MGKKGIWGGGGGLVEARAISFLFERLQTIKSQASLSLSLSSSHANLLS